MNHSKRLVRFALEATPPKKRKSFAIFHSPFAIFHLKGRGLGTGLKADTEFKPNAPSSVTPNGKWKIINGKWKIVLTYPDTHSEQIHTPGIVKLYESHECNWKWESINRVAISRSWERRRLAGLIDQELNTTDNTADFHSK